MKKEIYVVQIENEVDKFKNITYVGEDKEKALNIKPSSEEVIYCSAWVDGIEIYEVYKESKEGQWQYNSGKVPNDVINR